MIKHLHIKNFAIIDELDIDLLPGLTVITGETGSGKTIVMDALNFSLGGKADKILVRNGFKRAVVETELNNKNFRRILFANGRSKSFYNDEPVPLIAIKKHTETFVDFHGQHQQQFIMNVKNHINYLDSYCKTLKKVQMIKDLYYKLIAQKKNRQEIKEHSSEKNSRLELLNFQINEIDSVTPKIGEDIKLNKDYKRISKANDIMMVLDDLHNHYIIDENGTIENLNRLLKKVENLSLYDKKLDNLFSLLSNTLVNLEEAGSEIGVLLSDSDINEEEITAIESRISAIETLKRKYGGSIESVLEHREKIEVEIRSIKNKFSSEKEIDDRIIALESSYSKLALELHHKRKKRSKDLEKKIDLAMSNLNFLNSKFQINITQSDVTEGFMSFKNQLIKDGPLGIDQVEFYLSANKGEATKPLSSIASGGEISRVMLAIKSVFQDLDPVETLVFDEIDAGISGKSAESVAKQLVNLSKTKQIFCITHLSQIAVKADNHLHIVKKVKNEGTKVTANYLTQENSRQVIKNLFVSSEILGV
tara:strand:- start:6608 stop:8209 length:1602 start_codon:yes stop_codon:yes gene_type:complete